MVNIIHSCQLLQLQQNISFFFNLRATFFFQSEPRRRLSVKSVKYYFSLNCDKVGAMRGTDTTRDNQS